ncbi:MAG: tRNA uridine-5-carboxymethylaminomethyl(34) synthesis GTPase MnmE [Thermodesulfobacteriota bacterium]
MQASTIAAIATPDGFGGVGIIKISGPEAISLAARVFRHGQSRGSSGTSFCAGKEEFSSWRLYFGHIVDPETSRIIDEVILAVMRAPHSYTREDVVEVQAHAGPKVLYSILELLIALGARPAQPGEFTRRAFINGRIDLTQAEAVADLINASSDAAVDMAVSQVSGGLRSVIEPVRDAVISALGRIEAAIDFPDAVEDEINTPGLINALSEEVLEPAGELIGSYDAGRFLREGLKAVIAGGPNVGKSSLMNRLVNRERAIVTDIPGTTRDCIEASLRAGGVSVVLADTAGLRDDPEPIERLGIEKTLEYIGSADIVLFVVDVCAGLGCSDLNLYSQLPEGRKIVVINKSDLAGCLETFEFPSAWEDSPRVYVSALTGEGIDRLISELADMATGSSDFARPGFVPNWRQKTQLDRLHRAVSGAVSGLRHQRSPELISIDLREALSALDEITGRYVEPDVLDRIFSTYCIGK